jgi:hypothetical protein|tara:strand:+ start:828 stop:1994 length:1167 start_codon:yes stop_codon:yes gene_type:complete
MCKLRAVLVLFVCALGLSAQDALEGSWVDYAVEGKLTKIDAELAPTLREGMVFSAIYSVAIDADAVDLDEAASRARYFDVVDDVEVSIDLNYVLVYDAATGLGDRSIELTRAGGDLEFEQDLYSILLPLKGESIGEEGWTARWLQLWFYGEEGKMLASTDLQAPPNEFRTGWWRITFWNTEGSRSVLAEGMVEAAGEAGAPLSPSEQIAQLENAVVRLGNQLESQLSANVTLGAELDRARTRIEGLQQIVDVIVEERRILQDKYDLLKLDKPKAAPELVEEVATLEADLALWEEKELSWKDENQALGEALASAEADYSSLAAQLVEIEDQLNTSAPAPQIESETVEAVAEPEPIVIDIEPVVEAPKAKRKTPERKQRSVFRRPGKFRR